jgi:hypothetical protein
MSTVQNENQNEHDVAPAPGSHRAPRSRRPLYLGAAGVLVAALAATGGFLATRHGSTEQPVVGETVPTGPLTLPATVGAMAPDPQDPTQAEDWKTDTAKQLGDVEYHARTYRAPGSSLWIRVVQARTDLTGKLELAWAADAGQKVGGVNCTNNTRFSTGDPAQVRPTMMICWRTSAQRSVYALAIDPKAKTPLGTADAAAAAQQAWGQ